MSIPHDGSIVNISNNPNYIRPDYTFPYLPKSTSAEFFSWVNVNIPSEEFKTPKMHYMMIDELLGPETEVQAMVHREGAKSTVLTKYLPLYAAAVGGLPNFGRVVNCVIFSATYAQAVDLLKDLRNAWENSETLQETLMLAKNKQGKVIADKENHVCFVNSKGERIHIQAMGSGDSMRGTKKGDENGKSHRLELLIFDDILKDNILTSPKARLDLKKWYYGAVIPACNTAHNKKVVVGTPMTDDDLLMEMLRSKTYKTILLPIANKFYPGISVDELVSSWKDLHTPERILKAYEEAKEMGSADEFFREKMLEVVNDEMRIFKKEDFMYYKYKDLKPKLGELNFFTTMDLAISKKQSADDSVVMTIGVNSDGHVFVVECKGGIMNPREVMNEYFRQARMYHPLETRAEKAALQQVFDFFLNEEMMATGQYFVYNGLEYNSTLSKEYRVNTLQPLHRARKIHFPTDKCEKDIAMLVYQMEGYIRTGATTAHDDYVDCLANFLDPNFMIEPMQIVGSEIEIAYDMQEYIDDEEYSDSYGF